MSTCIVWIDSVHAKVFKINSTAITKKTIRLNEIEHSNNHHDAHLLNSEEKFFHNVALQIGVEAEQILILGAGVGKNNFKKHLEKHHFLGIYKHIIGVETLSEKTDNQILRASRQFFKKFNTFGYTSQQSHIE